MTRFGPGGEPIGAPVTLVNVPSPELRTPKAVAGNIEWNQRFGRRVLFKANYLKRSGTHEYILEPDPARGEVRLKSTGTSRYWELEATGRYLGGERRDLTVSYVRSHGTADLNNYDQFYGNLRNPILRAERARTHSHRRAASADRSRHHRTAGQVGHRAGDRDSLGLPVVGGERVPGLRRTAEPGGAFSESPHNRLRALASLAGPEIPVPRRHQGLQRPGRIGAERTCRATWRRRTIGQFFNPLERSIGFMFGSAQ